MRRWSILAASAALGVAAATGAQAAKWDMPMAYAASNFHSQNGKKFAQCVTEGTDGDLDVVTHPGGSLYGGAEIMRAVQTGQTPIGERLISAQANQNPLYGVDSIPFLATSYEQSEKLWDAAKGPIKAALKDDNLIYVYAVPWPPQGLYTSKPIDSVSDLEGVKFRAYNAATARIAELAGMTPVQIEAADLSQALATGVADAFMSSGATGVDRKVWEQLSHFYTINAWLPRNVVFVNKDSWDALDQSARKTISDCGDEAAKRGLKRSKELAQQYLDTLAENGMTVEDPSDKLKSQFKKFGQTMTDEWLEDAGAEGQKIIDAYRGGES